MKKIELEELKEIQIGILDYVADFCEKNSINYWLDCGTLLGAIRHKGYIPWDDDIDIGLLREDYDKLVKTFPDSERYELKCYEKDKNFNYAYGKILDKKTVLYEPSKECGEKISVNIDVFVYDNLPNNKSIIKSMYKKRDFYNKIREMRLAEIKYAKKDCKYILKLITYPIIHLISKDYIINKIISNSKKYSNIKCDYVGNFTSVSKFKGDKTIFDSFIKKEFEGKKYNVPVGYDKWLKAFYGDYMKLPPKEKRISHHTFEAYKLDK